MSKQYTINLNEQQLSRLIEMAKKGTLSFSDNDLIEYLEYILKFQKDDYYEMELDNIPF